MHTLDDTIDIAGEWWVPEKSDSRIPGQLIFSRHKGVELHLNQAFTPLKGSVRPGDPNPKYPVVQGISVKGEAVTLFDAQQFGTSFNFGTGGLRQPGRIHARVLVFGAHLTSDFHFIKVSFRVPGLQVWLGQQTIARELLLDKDHKPLRQSFTLIMIPEEQFRIPSINALASCYYSFHSKANAYSSIEVDVSA